MAPFSRHYNTVSGATLKKHSKELSDTSFSPAEKRLKASDSDSEVSKTASAPKVIHDLRVSETPPNKQTKAYTIFISTPQRNLILNRSILDFHQLDNDLRSALPGLVLPPVPRFLTKRRSFIQAISYPLSSRKYKKIPYATQAAELTEWLLCAVHSHQDVLDSWPWFLFAQIKQGDESFERIPTPVQNMRRTRSDQAMTSPKGSARNSLPVVVERKIRPRKPLVPATTLQDFQMLQVLGQGCMGKVLLVQSKKEPPQLYALKAIHKRQVMVNKELAHTLQEQRILRDTTRDGRNPFLIKLFWSFHDHDNLYLVLEYHPGGDLATQFAKDGRFGPDRARFYAAEIFEGVQGLHRCGIVYRDLKPENILIGHDGHIVLTDFGLSKQFKHHERQQEDGQALLFWTDNPADPNIHDYTSTFCGTAEYLAPEILRGEIYTYSVDWWSLGTLLYEMLVGLTPFWNEDHSEMYKKVLSEELEFVGYHKRFLDEDAMELLHAMLQKDPERRIDTEGIRNHAYFSMLNWDHVYAKRYIPPYVPPVSADGRPDPEFFDKRYLDQEPKIDPASIVENPAITENPERMARLRMPSAELLSQAIMGNPALGAKVEAGQDVFAEYVFDSNPVPIFEATGDDDLSDGPESPKTPSMSDQPPRPWSPVDLGVPRPDVPPRISSRVSSRQSVAISVDDEDWEAVDAEMSAQNGGTLVRPRKLRRKPRRRTEEVLSRGAN